MAAPPPTGAAASAARTPPRGTAPAPTARAMWPRTSSRPAPRAAAKARSPTLSALWRRSRGRAPKHVLPLSGSGRPLVAEAYERVATVTSRVFVLTEERQRGLIRDLVPELAPDGMIVEPAARGTTNALGLAAMTLLEL